MRLLIQFKTRNSYYFLSYCQPAGCGGHLLEVSQPTISNHIRTLLGRPRDVSEGRPQDVGRTRLLEL